MSMRTVHRFMQMRRWGGGMCTKHGSILHLIHNFHMMDMFEKIHQEYNASVASNPPSNDLCSCLMNIGKNGIQEKVEKIKAEICVDVLPVLTKPDAWGPWAKYLLYFYSKPALRDAAMYLHCVTGNI